MNLDFKGLRKKMHMSQAEFADKVGVSLRTVGSWERGESMPNAEQIWNCAIVLDCTPNDILGWNDDKKGLSRVEYAIVSFYRESSPQWQKNIEMTARAAAGESKTNRDLPEFESNNESES